MRSTIRMLATRADAEAARAELAALAATKLLRYSAPLREAYGRWRRVP
ncbi:MAG: hypothetical protein ACRDYD_05060 [Acidimicrobiales bacterium]